MVEIRQKMIEVAKIQRQASRFEEEKNRAMNVLNKIPFILHFNL